MDVNLMNSERAFKPSIPSTMGKIEDGQRTMIIYYDHPNVNRKRALKPEVGRILRNESS